MGRVAERQALRAALDAARGGTGAVVLVTGPAGIGKTRLLEQVATDAADAQVPVVWGRCPEDRGAPPLWPWRRVLVAADAAGVAQLPTSSGAAATPEDTAAMRVLVASAFTDALVRAAGPAALVVVLEDMHWADDASLAVLRYLAAEVRRSRLLVVASARDAAHRDLREPLTDLVALPGVELLPLGPLTPAGVAAYLSAAEGRAVDPAAVALVHEHSGGNPLYVRTLARVLGPELLRHVPPPEELARRLAGSSEVRFLVRATLRPLEADVQDLLSVASVLGEEIEPALLAEVAQRPLVALETALEAASDAGLLEPVPGAEHRRRFVHALVRDGVLAEVLPATRRRWHARAATVLEAAAATQADLASEVAHHWLRGAETPLHHARAVTWARAAAASASPYAPEEAARLLTAALPAARRARCADVVVAELLVELATAEYRAGAVAASLEHCRQSADIAELHSRPDLLAAAALVLRGIGHTSTATLLAELCERALRAAPHPPATVARLLAQRSLAHAELGRLEEARAGAVRALAAAEACGDASALLLAVHARVDTMDCVTAPEQREALADRALAAAFQAGQPLTRLWALLWRLDSAYQAGDPQAVGEGIARLEALARELPLPLTRWHVLRVRAAHAALVGDLAAARALNDEAMHVDLDDPTASGLSSAFRALLAVLTGDPTELGPQWWAGLESAPSLPIVDANKATALLLLDRKEEAEALYRRVMPLAPTLPRDGRWTGTLDSLVELAEAFADVEGAQVLHRLALPAAPWSGGPAAANMWSSGSGWRRVARAAALAGRRDDAIAAFERALDADIRLGARPFAVHDRLGLAELVADDDATRARTLAAQAAAEARAIGLPGPLQRADRLLSRLAAARPDPLTPRESEVVALVAQSQSNREIASALVLSERTVESHVRSILAKLGLTRRTEIVRWALLESGPP